MVVGELSIWRALEVQLAAQVRMGRLVLVEADGYYLPDTRATSYRTQHTKTTIGIDSMDLAAGRLTYFHNVGHYELAGEDYAGVFRGYRARMAWTTCCRPMWSLSAAAGSRCATPR